jgi:hypothetical protein
MERHLQDRLDDLLARGAHGRRGFDVRTQLWFGEAQRGTGSDQHEFARDQVEAWPRNATPKLRCFIDFLVSRFGAD